MSVKIEPGRDNITPDINRLLKSIDQLPEGAFREWRDQTPVRTGNARRRTRLSGDTIQAAYQYAVPLDRGSSPKAPDGMSRPTLEWLRRRMRQILRK